MSGRPAVFVCVRSPIPKPLEEEKKKKQSGLSKHEQNERKKTPKSAGVKLYRGLGHTGITSSVIIILKIITISFIYIAFFYFKSNETIYNITILQ